jgi:hypothetical protein
MEFATTSDRIARQYGVSEDNPIDLAAYNHTSVDYSEGDVPLSDPRLVRIDRIRLLTESGYPAYDVSYVYGTLRDGRHVRVDLGTYRIAKGRKGGTSLKGHLVNLAKAAGRHAHGLHMLDADVISILR